MTAPTESGLSPVPVPAYAIASIAQNRPELRLRGEQILSRFRYRQGSPESPDTPFYSSDEEVRKMAKEADERRSNAIKRGIQYSKIHGTKKSRKMKF